MLLPVVVRRRDVEVGGEQGDRLLGRAAAGWLGAGGSVASRRLLAEGAGGLPLSPPSPLKGRLLGAEGAGAGGAGTMQQRCFFLP